MTPDAAAAAAERTEAAQRMIGQAQDTDFVELVTLSGLELCVLGGPQHPLFDEPVARAWLQLSSRRRSKLTEWTTEGMAERGLLTEASPGFSPVKHGVTYALKPALGIALAARCRPAFIIATDPAVSNLRTPRFFALGDQTDPVRGVVVEEPAKLTAQMAAEFPHVKNLGPLGRFYRYVLVSQASAAAALAQLVIAPPGRPGEAGAPAWTVSLYHPRTGSNSAGLRLSVQGDGTTAHLLTPETGASGPGPASYDVAALSAVMLDLMTGRAG
jgi:hypothetical protein